jgi:hypothetical protein
MVEEGGPEYLARGFTTLLESVAWGPSGLDISALERMKSVRGPLNWGYVVAGDPPADSASASLQLAEWLAAGGRGCILPSSPSAALAEDLGRTARWFGLQALGREEGESFLPPPEWSGNPEEVLPRWTSEAARTFNIPGRGRVSQGAVADLLLWSTDSGTTPPLDLGSCRPNRVILNGRIIDLSSRQGENHGRFLGGN